MELNDGFLQTMSSFHSDILGWFELVSLEFLPVTWIRIRIMGDLMDPDPHGEC